MLKGLHEVNSLKTDRPHAVTTRAGPTGSPSTIYSRVSPLSASATCCRRTSCSCCYSRFTRCSVCRCCPCSSRPCRFVDRTRWCSCRQYYKSTISLHITTYHYISLLGKGDEERGEGEREVERGRDEEKRWRDTHTH